MPNSENLQPLTTEELIEVDGMRPAIAAVVKGIDDERLARIARSDQTEQEAIEKNARRNRGSK
jgi:hypothetical protein